ncbi:MAG: enoyl-CoA hydratase-related protein, partial [Steroidobacteraceae bacterium]
MADYKDIQYEVGANAVRITINRPEVMNAFRLQTVEELIDAFIKANEERSVNAVVLAGAGEKAFCTGGDQKAHLSEDGLYGPRGTVGLPIEELQTAIRDLRKVSIARVQGFAIGGGNVFATLCDLTIASEKAIFGQVGPKVGSVDPGWGTALLSRHVGEKRAREIWF